MTKDKALSPLERFFKAQMEMETPKLNKKAHQYNYADLAEIQRCGFPALYANGLGYKQTFEFIGDVWCTVGRVIDGPSAEIIYESFHPLRSGLKPQDIGSDQTYSKRYVMSTCFNLVAEEDDDGARAQKAAGNKPKFTPKQAPKPQPVKSVPITKDQIIEIQEMIEESGKELIEFNKFMKVNAVNELDSAGYITAHHALSTRIKFNKEKK